MQHTFKASKIITIQELIDLSKELADCNFVHIEISETPEDIVEGNNLITVLVNPPELIDLNL